jgi:hypothetical protein
VVGVGAPPGEVILALPDRFEPVTNVRSTLLIASIASVTAAGYGDAYFAALPERYRGVVRDAVAGAWLPLDVAMAHYQACSAIGLSRDALARLGRTVGEKTQGTLLGTAVRMAKEVGVSPWSVLPQFQRFWNRAYDGGGIAVYKLGPKEARLEVHKAAPLDTTYYRAAICGLAAGVLEFFCTRAYVTERPGPRVPASAIFRAQWV